MIASEIYCIIVNPSSHPTQFANCPSHSLLWSENRKKIGVYFSSVLSHAKWILTGILLLIHFPPKHSPDTLLICEECAFIRMIHWQNSWFSTRKARQSTKFFFFSLLSRCGQCFSRIVIIRIRGLSRREEEVSRLRANQLAFYHSCFSLPRRDNMMEKLTYQIRNLLAAKIIPKKEWTIDTRRDGWWGYFDPIFGACKHSHGDRSKRFLPRDFWAKNGLKNEKIELFIIKRKCAFRLRVNDGSSRLDLRISPHFPPFKLRMKKVWRQKWENVSCGKFSTKCNLL